MRQVCVTVWSRRKLDSDLPNSAYPWAVSVWEQGWVLPAGTAACTRSNSLKTEKRPCITLHLEWEAAWHWPCNLRACLLQASVAAILLISCCVLPALSTDPSSPVPILPRMPNAKLYHAEMLKSLFPVDETRMIFSRITVYLMLFPGLEVTNLWRKTKVFQ